MVVEDKVVTAFNLEETPGKAEISSGDAMLAAL